MDQNFHICLWSGPRGVGPPPPPPPPPYGQPDCKKTVFSVVDDFPKGMVPKKKKTEKVWSFAKLGGGVSEGSKKPNLYFGKVFFH